MKTAISIPNDTFARVERCAADLGISRSEFFSRAARCFIEQLDAQALVGRIDAAVDLVDTDESNQAAVVAGRRRLAAEDDEW